MASVSALRTRTSLNGFVVWFSAMPNRPVAAVSCTTTLSPSCLRIASTSARGSVRNSIYARPDRRVAARTEVSVLMKNL